MTRTEILGRESSRLRKLGHKGCAYIGKVVSYPAGRYEEVGEMFMDIVFPHCILVLGKRGSGKSYTLGVIAEEFGFLQSKYRDRISVIMVDTMSVFHSLKKENNITEEIRKLATFANLQARGFPDYSRIFMPKSTIEKVREMGRDIAFDNILQLSIKDIEIYDWLSLFNLTPTEPAGVLIARAIDKLRSEKSVFGFQDIFEEIKIQFGDEYLKEGVINLFRMVENIGIFGEVGTPMEEIVRGGQLSILDMGYIGHVSGFDIRNLVVGIISRKLLLERTLHTTVEMQAEASLTPSAGKNIMRKTLPMVYMMLDEAHLFIPRDRKTLSSTPLIDWINLGRHSGLSLLMATQSPSSIDPHVLGQSDLVIAHNISSADDIEALNRIQQTYMKGSRDLRTLVSSMDYLPGLAVIFDDRTRKVEMCRIRPRCSLHLGIDASAIPLSERMGLRSTHEVGVSTRKKRPASEIIKDLQRISD
jgi:hypothetical protein